MYHDIGFPEQITKLFPEASKTKYSNGVISFSTTFSLVTHW